MRKELSGHQRKFIGEYMKDQNAAQAAVRAGLNYGSADRLMANPAVKAEIEKRLKVVEEKANVSAIYVLSSLKEVAERCMQRVPVMIRDPDDGRRMIHKTEEDKHGVDQGVWEFDSNGANRALELLGKHLKLFTDRVEHDVSEDLAAAIREARLRRKNAK